jgi:hypothetical protein
MDIDPDGLENANLSQVPTSSFVPHTRNIRPEDAEKFAFLVLRSAGRDVSLHEVERQSATGSRKNEQANGPSIGNLFRAENPAQTITETSIRPTLGNQVRDMTFWVTSISVISNRSSILKSSFS